MGIPAFFAYIAKNHTKIIKKLEYLNRVHNLLFVESKVFCLGLSLTFVK